MTVKQLVRVGVAAAGIAICLSQAGCGSFWRGGAAGATVGTVGTGAVYEARAKNQLERLEEDRAAGRIDQREYEIRKDQIQKGSLLY